MALWRVMHLQLVKDNHLVNSKFFVEATTTTKHGILSAHPSVPPEIFATSTAFFLSVMTMYLKGCRLQEEGVRLAFQLHHRSICGLFLYHNTI